MEIPKLLIIPILAGLTAQVSKVLVEAIRTGSVNLTLLNTYGGMPSSHTALVVSLTTVIGLGERLDSAAFAIAFVFSLITIRDAIGFRMYLSEHARILNKLIADVPAKEKPRFPAQIIERIGHTRTEALMGGLVGLTASL
ncbi:MAG: divergent PAP2 family protein, partial [Candidatus Kerfeldbacteria bacterium]|nr:divergent PAP2 family protein [Candidatus Kerfeldbacteria bacterium]